MKKTLSSKNPSSIASISNLLPIFINISFPIRQCRNLSSCFWNWVKQGRRLHQSVLQKSPLCVNKWHVTGLIHGQKNRGHQATTYQCTLPQRPAMLPFFSSLYSLPPGPDNDVDVAIWRSATRMPMTACTGNERQKIEESCSRHIQVIRHVQEVS